MLKGGTALELADNRQKDETMGKLINHILKKDNLVLNEYYFQDVEKQKLIIIILVKNLILCKNAAKGADFKNSAMIFQSLHCEYSDWKIIAL